MKTSFQYPFLSQFLPESWSRQGHEPDRTAIVSRDDLFGSLSKLLSHKSDDTDWQAARSFGPGEPIAVIVVSPQITISFNRFLAKPFLVQVFVWSLNRLANVHRFGGAGKNVIPIEIDPSTELTVWCSDSAKTFDFQVLWDQLTNDIKVSSIESSMTAKLYGSKERITDFVISVAAATVPVGTTFLDLMSGTGIISRKLATRFPVVSNDANPYAACLTRFQTAVLVESKFNPIMNSLRPRYQETFEKICGLVPEALEVEAGFLHGDYDETSLQSYINFCDAPISLERFSLSSAPFTMMLRSYSNAYFGVRQAVELDALRSAIETVKDEATKDLLLGMLILVACICATGPHFAQPRKVKSISSFRNVAERRARSVFREFELALRRVSGRSVPPFLISPITSLDWREALPQFISDHPGGAVYVDPPYTKLQYSRYYHVLNTLLSYDCPPLEGKGRYPPRSMRFSSRFEYHRGPAEKEFGDLFSTCANAGLILVVSYSDKGLVPVESLRKLASENFSNVEIFSNSIRHHSQGVPLSKDFRQVNEYVFVARN